VIGALAPTRVVGIDFSGARHPGKRIWVTRGTVEGATLRVERCQRAESLPGSGIERERCLEALRAWIAGQEWALVGMDVPFGLPAALVQEPTWERFVQAFPARYPCPERFREDCLGRANGREWRRLTDVQAATPFCVYNLRLYRQTYWALQAIVGPLVERQAACVLPMQPALPGRPWLVEICPASTLKRERRYGIPYKGGRAEHRAAREQILAWLEGPGQVVLPPDGAQTRAVILDDAGGDALDSLVAAYAAARLARCPDPRAASTPAFLLEGYVYT